MLQELKEIEDLKVEKQRIEILENEKAMMIRQQEEDEKLKIITKKKLEEREYFSLQLAINILFTVFVYNEIIILSGKSHIRMTVYFGVFFLAYFIAFGIYLFLRKLARLSFDCLKDCRENGLRWPPFESYFFNVFLSGCYIFPAFIEHCLWLVEILLYYPHGLFRAVVGFLFSFWDTTLTVEEQTPETDLKFRQSLLAHKTVRYRRSLEKKKEYQSNIYNHQEELERKQMKSIESSKREEDKAEIDKLLSISFPVEEIIDPSSM